MAGFSVKIWPSATCASYLRVPLALVPPSLAGMRRNFVTDLVMLKRCEVCEVHVKLA